MGWIGKQIGPGSCFHVLRRLSTDDLGKTYEARDTRDGTLVVLKALRRSLSRNREAVARLDEEINAQIALDHPGLALYRGRFEVGDAVVIYRPYAVGGSLEALLGELPEGLPPERARAICGDVLDSLSYAHSAGLSHLALSPRVVYVGPESQGSPVSLIDFGLPRVVGHSTYVRVYTDSPYLAPEQRSSASNVDHRADIYAVGALLRALLTGRPSRGQSDATVPGELEEIIRRATEFNPIRRYLDAKSFRYALDGREEGHTPTAAMPSVLSSARSGEAGQDDERPDGSDGVRLAAILVRPVARATSRRPSSGKFRVPGTARNTQSGNGTANLAAVRAGSAKGGVSDDEPTTRVPLEKWASAPTEEWAHAPTPVLSVPTLATGDDEPEQLPRYKGLPLLDIELEPLGPETEVGPDRSAEPTAARGDEITTPVAGFSALGDVDAVAETLELAGRYPTPAIGLDIISELDEMDDDEPEDGTFTPTIGLPVLTDMLRRSRRLSRSSRSEPAAGSDTTSDPTTVIMPDRSAYTDASDEDGADSSAEEAESARGDSVEWVLFTGDLEPVSDDDIAELERIGASDILDILAVSSPRLAISSANLEAVPRVKSIAKGSSDKNRASAKQPTRRPSRAIEVSAAGALVAAVAVMLLIMLPPLITELTDPGVAALDIVQVGSDRDSSGHVVGSTASAPLPEARSVFEPADEDDSFDDDETDDETDNEMLMPTAMVPSHESVATHLSGSLQFNPALWQVGNTWIFHLEGSAEPESPELDYFISREITDVAPHPWGHRVELAEVGGTAAPRTREVYVSTSCVIDPATERILFCLPAEADRLETRVVAGTTANVFETTRGGASILFDPSLGWVAETGANTAGRRVTAQLVGYRVGSRVGGAADQPVVTCAWDETVEQGVGIGRTDRDGGLSEPLRQALEWGIEGRLRYIDMPIGLGFGSRHFEAWYSRHETGYVVTGQMPNRGAGTSEPTPEIVELPLDRVALWRAADSTTHLALLFQHRGAGTVRLLTFVPGREVIEQTLVPESEIDGGRLRMSMVARSSGCGIEVQRSHGDSTRWAQFELAANGATRIGGDL